MTDLSMDAVRRAASLAELAAAASRCSDTGVDCNISVSARTIEIEDVVAAVRIAASFLQLDAAEQACTTHPHGPVNCTEEVQARRGQIQDLELSVRRATTTVELDAAEDSCTN